MEDRETLDVDAVLAFKVRLFLQESLLLFNDLHKTNGWQRDIVKPPIKDTLKEDRPPNKGQDENTHSIENHL